MKKNILLSIVMPCLNEAKTIGVCIKKAQLFINEKNIEGEIIVADNGSIDGSQKIALDLGAKVINVREKGYGNALKAGIKEASGKYIIMGDSDDSYDFYNLGLFLEKLEEGYDLVMGNRFKGGIEKNAMPFLHKYLGNPVLSFIGNLFFKVGIGDFHCGLRAFRKEAIISLNLITGGMEFASEMVVKAKLNKLKITEVPIKLYKDGRDRKPHLNTWRDGWRHLKFLLIYSPTWMFALPGISMVIIGLFFSIVLFFGDLNIGNVILGIHTMLYSIFSVIIGTQILMLYLFANIYGVNQGLLPKTNLYMFWVKHFKLEKAIIVSVLIIVLGFAGAFYSLFEWYQTGFKSISPEKVMRVVMPSATFILLGIQFFFSSFFLEILNDNKSI